MKVHRYELTDYHSFGIGEIVYLETRLYSPNYHAVLVFGLMDRDLNSKSERIIRVSTNRVDVEQAKRIITPGESGARYMGVVELPNDIVSKVISAGKLLKYAEARLRDSSRMLCELI